MNDPAAESVACVSTLARHGSIKIGSIEMPLTAAVHIQFAIAGMEDEELGLANIVPGSTALDTPPVFIENPFANPAAGPSGPTGSPAGNGAPSSPSAQPAPSVQGKKHPKKHRRNRHKRKKHRSSKRGGNAKHRHRLVAFSGVRASAAGGPTIGINVELAADIEEFNLLVSGSEELETGVAMKLPLRLHLEGEGLGSNCYIGSVSQPIVIEPEKVKAESTLFFGHDPNGFNVQLIGSGGSKLEDRNLAVPTATGCGLGGIHNGDVNELAGLPSAPGSSRMVFADNVFRLIAAGYDGTAPEGGAELQAAFDAAQE